MAEQVAPLQTPESSPSSQTPSAEKTGMSGTKEPIGSILRRSFLRSDLFLAFAIAAIVVILIIPMPPWVLDVTLSLSLTIAVLVLMTVIFIQKALELNTFPVILLITTLLRLALNLASTRLILQNGHEGTDAAGQVIQAFGGFIMGENFVIGVVVFLILILVNFIVITKGSTRIAEVTARFTLDALPGKQMAIDADLSAGTIDESEAITRRRELQKETDFFGAMDGASKFVRGDAVASIIITAVNIIGGMIIGIVQNDMLFSEAADTYTRLTVGDGLISQIPALLISVASGLMVSKAGISQSTERALGHQFTQYPKALGMSSAVAGILALIPGTPFLPFILLSVLTGGVAWITDQRHQKAARHAAEMVAESEGTSAPVAEEPITSALKMDMVRLELGYGLLSMISAGGNQRLTEQIKALRRALATEMGFVMPSVRIQDNMQLTANQYSLFIKEVEAGSGELRPNMLLVMDPRGEEITIPGEKTREPTFGLPAVWVETSSREEALFRGYTVVDPATVITTHLTEVVRDNMAELLSYAETQKLLDELDKDHQKLVADLVPNQINTNGIQRILQNLLTERVSIRDLPTILEGISEASASNRNLTSMTEHIRMRLARQLCDAYTDEEGVISLVTLSPEWEQCFVDSLIGQGDERQLAIPPSQLHEFINGVRQTFERFAMQGETPVLLTSPMIRAYVRSVIERFRPMTTVMSQNEIHPRARIKTLGHV